MRNEESNFNETDILDTSSMDIETVKIGKKNTKESRFVKKHTNMQEKKKLILQWLPTSFGWLLRMLMT